MDIPQEVRDRVVNKLNEILKGNGRWLATVGETADEIIPLAQLPIAPATEEEIKRFHEDCVNCPLDLPVVSREYALNLFISRRNSSPQTEQVDPLIMKIIEGAKDGGVTLDAGIAWYIAAAVRQEQP
jgi:hypothetical protein